MNSSTTVAQFRPSRPMTAAGPTTPTPRGELSAQLLSCLATDPGHLSRTTLVELLSSADNALRDGADSDDVQVSLWILYQLHYQGLAGVDDCWEWHPFLVQLTGLLEQPFELQLRRLAGPHLPDHHVTADDLPRAIADVIRSADSRSLSSFLAREANREQYTEFLIHRSLYHLIEADPHSWAIPRLRGGPKVALVEIQADEYGAGLPDWMHATLFADTMRDLGLDPGYGHYIDALPAVTLAWMNAMTLFGLHRRLRGAVCGHLAALEMTSSLPNRRYGNGLRRLGLTDAQTTRYFDEHVEADAVHEQIAANDLAAELARQHPELITDILFGAASAVITDARVAGHLLDSWRTGRSSLRDS